MKNLFLTLLIIISTFLISKAQVEKGRFMVGGSISPSYSKNIYPTHSFQSLGFNSNVKVGYFLVKNFVLGINESMSFGSSWEDNNGDSYHSSFQNHGIALFSRYYFLNFKKISLFGEGKAGIVLEKASSKETYNSNYNSSTFSYSYSNTFVNYSGALGVDYFVSRNVAIELSINYNYLNPISGSVTYSSNLSVNGMPKISSTNVFLGFQIFF